MLKDLHINGRSSQRFKETEDMEVQATTHPILRKWNKAGNLVQKMARGRCSVGRVLTVLN